MRSALHLILVAVLAACKSAPSRSTEDRSLPQVTRAEILATAEAYRTHRWLAGDGNVRHGYDERGVRVDTPDMGYRRPGSVPARPAKSAPMISSLPATSSIVNLPSFFTH